MTVSVPSATVIKVGVSSLIAAMRSGTYNPPDASLSLQDVITMMMTAQTFVDKQGKKFETGTPALI